MPARHDKIAFFPRRIFCAINYSGIEQNQRNSFYSFDSIRLDSLQSVGLIGFIKSTYDLVHTCFIRFPKTSAHYLT